MRFCTVIILATAIAAYLWLLSLYTQGNLPFVICVAVALAVIYLLSGFGNLFAACGDNDKNEEE